MKFSLLFFNRFFKKNLSAIFLVSLSLLTVMFLISFNNLKQLENIPRVNWEQLIADDMIFIA